MTRTKHPIPWPWPSERRILIDPEPADEERLTLLYLRLDQLGVPPRNAWSWPDVYKAGLLPRGHDAVPKLKKLGYPTFGKNVLLLDEITLARLVAGEDPVKWDLDASLIARSEFIELSLKHDYIKQFLAGTLIEKASYGSSVGVLPNLQVQGRIQTAIDDLEIEIASLKMSGTKGFRWNEVRGETTGTPIDDPDQEVKLEELEAVLEILEGS